MTLESVAGYHRLPSPPYRALREVEASPRREYLQAALYMFHRYLALRPEGLGLLAPAPGKEVDRLADHWISGGAKTIFFLAEPERTDLESIAPEARRVVSRWEWPFAADRLPSKIPQNRLGPVSFSPLRLVSLDAFLVHPRRSVWRRAVGPFPEQDLDEGREGGCPKENK